MLRIGVTDWNLNLGANPEAVPLAAKLGFEGYKYPSGESSRMTRCRLTIRR